MAELDLQTEVGLSTGSAVYNGSINIDETVKQDVVFEWIPEGMEGGPVMRPKEAPRQ